jgi:hypothetical protein
MDSASPWALLMTACFSPSERAMKASRSPVAMLICSWRRPSEAAISARFSRSAVICACMACRISFGGRQVLDFVAQHLHAPVQRRFVDGLHHLGVDDVALFKGLVQLQLADHERSEVCASWVTAMM